MVKVVLTADRTLLSGYNGHVFLGFAACAPKLLPEWLYTKIFCPPVEEENNRLKYAHCGQRKIEAALLKHGFREQDIAIVNSEKLHHVVNKETRVLGITTHDPLGLGPASSMFSDLMNKETYTASFFRKLMSHPLIRKYNLKVIVGGSGAWQLTDERIMAKYGIDCVVVGEGEITAVDVIDKAMNGDSFPSIVQGDVVPLEQIPLIHYPTINGIIEICRGCGRGCRFCNPTMLNYRSQPLEFILQEAKVNVDAGNGVLFHAEDVLRYKTKGFIPDEKEVLRLFTEVKKLTDRISFSHFAHASVASNPGLIVKISEELNVGSKTYPFMSGQAGVESGSPQLITRYMKGKAKPFTPKEWPEMILNSHQILRENHWVPVDTMILGLPGETPEDVRKSNELVQDLSDYRSLIIPLYFVPIGFLKDNHRFFRTKDMYAEHWQLFAACIRHSIKWAYALAGENLTATRMKWWKKAAIKQVIRIIDRRLDPYLKLMDEGINPRMQNT
ncbi:Radical SAM superfamily protein [uncultured archaeon]|nr:Radical SAM superfamily protein [uncultured archaeon]